MKGRYEKTGTATRVEHSRFGTWIVQTSESGSSHFEGERFVSSSHGPRDAAPIDYSILATQASELIETLPDGVSLQRLVFSSGTADHRYDDGTESRSWRETSWRAIAEMGNERLGLQLTIHVGGEGEPGAWSDELLSCARELARLEPHEGRPDRPILLHPRAAAGLLAALGQAHGEITVDGFQQVPSERRDGIGRPVEPFRLSGGSGSFPNIFRPSYRSRPMPYPIDVGFDSGRSVDREDLAEADVAEAIAGDARRDDRIFLTVMTSGRSGSALFTLSAMADDWLRSITANVGPLRWFPEGTGVWAGGLLVDSAELDVHPARSGVE
ncbi:MAG: hypothetical protein KY459_07750 [Acidobacteria bacterium]|nr:hypothetical protein [Acidobacteriota bacterium]